MKNPPETGQYGKKKEIYAGIVIIIAHSFPDRNRAEGEVKKKRNFLGEKEKIPFFENGENGIIIKISPLP